MASPMGREKTSRALNPISSSFLPILLAGFSSLLVERDRLAWAASTAALWSGGKNNAGRVRQSSSSAAADRLHEAGHFLGRPAQVFSGQAISRWSNNNNRGQQRASLALCCSPGAGQREREREQARERISSEADSLPEECSLVGGKKGKLGERLETFCTLQTLGH